MEDLKITSSVPLRTYLNENKIQSAGSVKPVGENGYLAVTFISKEKHTEGELAGRNKAHTLWLTKACSDSFAKGDRINDRVDEFVVVTYGEGDAQRTKLAVAGNSDYQAI